MPKYVVTGGEDGQSGINLNGQRYEPGDIVEVVNPKKLWLIDAGYLTPATSKAVKVAALQPEPPSEEDEV
jgi:hypothetical protein